MKDTCNRACHHLMRFAARFTNRWLGMVILFLVAIVHPLIHATPLDSGALDSIFANLQAWAAMNLHLGSDES